ncbi:unnamed protein product, partial [marine sediment metagenome]
FPEGLGILATCLGEAGHEVEGLDINAHRYTKEEVAAKIAAAEYDLVGMGGLITVYGYMAWFTGICKQYHPDKPVILGGNAVTPIPRLIMENTRADAACVGEGELTIVEVADALAEGRSLAGIAGIWYREGDGTVRQNARRPVIRDLDTIPLADRDVFPTAIYTANTVGSVNRRKWIDGEAVEEAVEKRSFMVRVSRGCPFRCRFCYHDFMGEKFRVRSPQAVISEMEYLKDRFAVNYFGLGDDMATFNRKTFSRICELIQERMPDIRFFTSLRGNLATDEYLQLLRDSGCEMVCYGLESGSQRILDAMDKRVTIEQQRNAVLLTQKHFGWADTTFIVGFPGETEETVRETINFCKDVDLEPEAIFYATPYPGTWLYGEALRRGLITNEHEFLLSLGEQGERPVVNFTEWSDEELIAIKENMARELNAWNKEFTADGKMTG